MIEAVILLAVMATGVRLLPFRRAIRLGSCGIAGTPRPDRMRQTGRAVEFAATVVPWRSVCLQQGLALQWMLRRRGLDARLRYGIASQRESRLEAHVWVTVEDITVLGGDQAAPFATVATFP